MLFSDRPRTHYEKTLAHEVICQLRFPTILSINNVEPADFQERIREDFPQYARKQDVLPPQIVNGKPEPQPPVTNYHFLSQDGRWTHAAAVFGSGILCDRYLGDRPRHTL